MDDSYIDELFFKINGLRPNLRRDLRIMWRSVQRIRQEISQEQVECRRRKVVTEKLKDLQAQLDATTHNLEQYIVFATLLDS